MNVTLRSYQAQAVEDLKGSPHFALFWQPRLGKTFPTILLMRDKETVLILGKPTLLDSWLADLKAIGETDVCYIQSSWSANRKKKALASRPKWLLLTYRMATILNPHHHGYSHGIVVDESHRIGAYETQQTRWCVSVAPLFESRAILTGTPASEGWIKLMSQFIFLIGNFMGHKTGYSFLTTHARYDEPSRKWKLKYPMTEKKVREWMQENSHTLNYEDVGMSGFDQQFSLRSRGQSKAQRSMMNNLRAKITQTRMDFQVEIGYRRSIGAGVDPFGDDHCLERTHDAVDHILDLECPALVLSFYRLPVEWGHEYAVAKGLRSAYITGDTPVYLRTAIIAQFNAGELDVVFATPDPVCEGVSFQPAGAILFLSNDWKTSTREQVSRRANYPGRPSPVLIVDWETRDCDEVIHKCLSRKVDVSESYR